MKKLQFLQPMRCDLKKTELSPKNPSLQINRQLLADIHTSLEVMDSLTILWDDDFESRFAGTLEERKAAKFIEQTSTRYRLKDVRLDDYVYAGCSRGLAAKREQICRRR